jgi:DNA repair protein RecO (recombination protein O)
MPEHTTHAVILDLKDYGEIDRIITFYTSDFGKVKGIAKGAKKSQKRFGAATDLFSHVHLSFFTKETSGLVRLNHCKLLQAFPHIQNDIVRIGFGSYVAELINEMTAERVLHRELFEILVKLFSILDTVPPKEDYIRIFEMRLLDTLGYRPCLNNCVECRKELKKGLHLRFSIARGGVICSSCACGEKNLFPVSLGTLKLLEKASSLHCDKIQRLIFSSQALEESREIMPRFIEHHIEKELKTLKFFAKMEQMRC